MAASEPSTGWLRESIDLAWVCVAGWSRGLAGLRDALGQLPRIPCPVWLGGALLLLIWRAAHGSAFRRRLRAAQPAPRAVRRLVTAAARDLGLRYVPPTLMLDGFVSPMIWGGRRPCLILPTRLWSQLDEFGRRAIVHHELAHLRRWDHWVCRFELLVTALFWWHPVLWWVRRRLYEEADLCCDAWVTWLMPDRRRAYAETLLQAKAFVSAQGDAVPAGGLGATSVGARRFARRIVMVMTGSDRPGLSATGIVLAGLLAIVGWVTVPAWASPEVPVAPAAAGGQPAEDIVLPAAEVIVTDEVDAPKALTPARGIVTGGSADRLDERLADIERQLETLAKQLAELRELASDLRGAGGRSTLGATRSVRSPRAPRPPRGPRSGGGGAPRLPAPADSALVSPLGIASEADLETRSYALPKGKLAALTKLMVRGDVPLLVSPQHESLEVHGTPKQHEVFAGFVDLIHPADPEKAKRKKARTVARTYSMSEGKLSALSELMIRSDVPILVSPSGKRIKVQATPEQHERFAAFVELIEPRAALLDAIGPWQPSAAATLLDSDEIEARTYSLPEGKLDALLQLMLRSDVPIRVRQTERGIEVHATPRQHRIFVQFVSMIHPTGEEEAETTEHGLPDVTEAAEQAREEAAARRQAWSLGLGQALAQLDSHAAWSAEIAKARAIMRRNACGEKAATRGQLAAINALLKQLRSKAETRQAEAQALLAQVESVLAEADVLIDNARELLEKADDGERASATRELKSQARVIERKAVRLQRIAKDLEQRADVQKRTARQLESAADELDCDVVELQGSVDADAEGEPVERDEDCDSASDDVSF